MQIQIRSGKEGKEQVELTGYVHAVDRFSRTLPSAQSGGKTDKPFKEKVKPGVFSRSLEKRPDIACMFNHRNIIGAVEEGNLQVTEDAVGLKARAVTDDPEVVKAAKEGKLTGWSFSFINEKDEWNSTRTERTLTELDLLEVSVLSDLPAYYGTVVEVNQEGIEQHRSIRSFEDKQEEIKKEEAPKKEEIKEDIQEEEVIAEIEVDADNCEFCTYTMRLQIDYLELKGGSFI